MSGSNSWPGCLNPVGGQTRFVDKYGLESVSLGQTSNRYAGLRDGPYLEIKIEEFDPGSA